MMRYQVLFVLLGMMFSSVLHAADAPKIQFECATHPYSTSFRAETFGNTVTLRVVHNNGANYIPVSSRVLLVRDIVWADKLGAALKQMGASYSFTFDMSLCAQKAPDQMNCFGTDTININGVKVENVNFYTGKITRQFLGASFTDYMVSLSFMVNGETYYTVELPYDLDSCRF